MENNFSTRRKFEIVALFLVCLGTFSVTGLAGDMVNVWTFDNGLLPRLGDATLEYRNAYTERYTWFESSDDGFFSPIDGKKVDYIYCPQSAAADGYQLTLPGVTSLSVYTLAWDFNVPQGCFDNHTYLGIFNTNPTGNDDADLFIKLGTDTQGALFVDRDSDNTKCWSAAGVIRPDTWHRVVFAYDEYSTSEDVRVFVDGIKVAASDTAYGNSSLRLPGTPVLFQDNTGESTPLAVSSFVVLDRALTDAEVTALGSATAGGFTTFLPNIPGDANRDGRVDGSDVTILAGNWQVLQNATWEMGDFNSDGKVDGSDVTILAGNWQSGVNTAAASVPEPGLFQILIGFMFFLMMFWGMKMFKSKLRLPGFARWSGMFAVVLLAIVPSTHAQEKEKKVLIIGLDGIRSDAYHTALTPNMDALIANGIVSYKTQSEDITISGTCWTSILHGVHRDLHKVEGNADYGDPSVGNDLGSYPDVFQFLEDYDPSLVTTRFTRWTEQCATPTGADTTYMIRNPDGTYPDDEYCMAESALYLAGNHPVYTDDPDVFFIYTGNIDSAGHSYNFSPVRGSKYNARIEDMDAEVGNLMQALQSRATYEQEDWLVIMVTDHGGIYGTHGSTDAVVRTVPLIVSGNSVIKDQVYPNPNIADVTATVLAFMDVPESQWGDLIDGKPFGTADSPIATPEFSTNLLFNGDAEYNRGATGVSLDRNCSGWDDFDVKGFSVVDYDAITFDATFPWRGENFFHAGESTSASMVQTIDVANLDETIGIGGVTFTLSGWFGGASAEEDRVDAEIRFYDEEGTLLSTELLMGATAAERNNKTKFIQKLISGDVPSEAESVQVELISHKYSGTVCDGFVDNLSLTFFPLTAATAATVPEPSVLVSILLAGIMITTSRMRKHAVASRL